MQLMSHLEDWMYRDITCNLWFCGPKLLCVEKHLEDHENNSRYVSEIKQVQGFNLAIMTEIYLHNCLFILFN